MPEMPRYTWGAKGFGRNPLRAAGTEEFEPMRVLIVEDEPLVALELEELLLDEGFEVVGSAADAAQAIDLGRRHRPDFIIISAGFDAHRLDPLGGLNLVEADFAWATERLMEIAEQHAKGRIVSVLEGGYHLEGLARSVAAHVAALMGA
jgi:acetoin utilization deacetylase AcuC-like enzyme